MVATCNFVSWGLQFRVMGTTVVPNLLARLSDGAAVVCVKNSRADGYVCMHAS